MLNSPLLPILILILGAFVLLLLEAVPRIRYFCLIATGFAGMALLALMRLVSSLPLEVVASSWRPLALFGAPLTIEVNLGNWILATVLVGVTFLSLLAFCVSSDGSRPSRVALILMVAGAGMAALFVTSFVALVVAWGAVDVLLGAALLPHGHKGRRRAGLALLSGLLATSALWAASLLNQTEGISNFIHLADFAGQSATLLQVALVLRLGLVPLHLWRPIDLDAEPGQLIPLVVVPTLLGFDLLTYLPALTAGLPSVLFALAALTVLVGGFVAWSESEERLSLAGVVVAETGLAVLAVANAGEQAVATAIAAAVAWSLGVTVFALMPGWSGRQFWHSVPSLLTLLSLLGIPAFLGFVVRFTAYSGLEADLLVLSVAILGEAFVVAALVRLWFWAEPRPLPSNGWLQGAYLVLFIGLSLLLLYTGLTPEILARRIDGTALLALNEFMDQGGIAGWAGWALPLVGGLTLFLAGEGLRQRLESGWRGLGGLLRLEWVYGLVYLLIRQVGRLLRGVSSIVEGEGALLWTVVILLIIVLYLTGGSVGPSG
jgi:formate hydrogenlyase subunit 3/multisubunit Na+/H+ antiporter MnhD subunit